jgi:hypothetical protein
MPSSLVPLPVWFPTKPSRRSDRYFFFAPKLCREVSASSKLEFERTLLLEHDPSVATYCEQPQVVHLVSDGRQYKSRFDFWVRTARGEVRYEEIKYQADLDDPNSRAQRQIVTQRLWCRIHGYAYAVVTERTIWEKPTLLVSLRVLFGEYDNQFPQRRESAATMFAEIIEEIKSSPGISFGDLLRRRDPGAAEETYRLAVTELIRLRRIDACLATQHFSLRSPLFPGEGLR